MGLSLEVGILADLNENDEEGAEDYRKIFSKLNEQLETHGVAPHHEPEDCGVWGADMFGYAALSELQSTAAYHDRTGQIPPTDSQDPELAHTYHGALTTAHFGPKPGLLKRLFEKKCQFSLTYFHLFMHSDTEGFYLPQDFEHVLYCGEEIPGSFVGSCPRLLNELNQLAAGLEIPDGMDCDDDIFEDLASEAGGPPWKQNKMATHACLTLREACKVSIETGAALVYV